MIVKVRLFASFRETANDDYMELELRENATYGELQRIISEKLNVSQNEVKLLADDAPVKFEETVSSDIKIVAFPPVAGG